MNPSEISQAIDEQGFLSPAIDEIRLDIKDEFNNDFAKTKSLSDKAQALMMHAEVDPESVHLLAALVFLQRTVKSSQAAVILCERGLISDALTLVRTAAENLFFGIALIKKPSVFVRMARAGDIEEKKQADSMLRSCNGLGLTEKNREDLLVISERGNGTGPAFSAFDAASAAELTPLYDTLYRGLSNVASHATLRSLDDALEIVEDQRILKTGPTSKNLAFTLGLVNVCLEQASSGLYSMR